MHSICPTQCSLLDVITVWILRSLRLTAVTAKIVLCCDVTPSSLIELYRRFGRTFCFKLQDRRMKVETACSSELSVNLYKATVITSQKPVTVRVTFYLKCDFCCHVQCVVIKLTCRRDNYKKLCRRFPAIMPLFSTSGCRQQAAWVPSAMNCYCALHFTLYTHILGISASRLLGYHLYWLKNVQNTRIVIKIRSRFLPYPFQIIIHLPCCHLALYNLQVMGDIINKKGCHKWVRVAYRLCYGLEVPGFKSR